MAECAEQMLPIAALAFVAALLLSLLTLHAGAELAVALLGRERCLSTESVNGTSWWPLSVLLSTGLVAFMAGSHGYGALAFVPVGPVVAIVLVALSLRFGERSARRREFVAAGGRVVEAATGAELRPAFVVADGSYRCTGPASGYTLHALTLHDASGRRFANGYVSKQENDRVFAALTREHGCLGLSLVVQRREGTGPFRSVALGSEWTPLLCGGLERLDAADRAWWAQWLQPSFGLLGACEVNPQELARHLDALQDAYPEAVERDDRMLRDLGGMRALLPSAAAAPLWLLTAEAHSQAVEQARGRGWVCCSAGEDGTWIEAIEGVP